MQQYFLLIIYSPALTKEHVEEKIFSEIYPVFDEYNIPKPKYVYSGHKSFSYIIKKHKSGHFVSLSFQCNLPEQKANITLLTKRINEIQEVIRVLPYRSKDPAVTIATLSEININVDANIFYL